MRSREIREYALERLRGKWGIAILISLVASALGGNIADTAGFGFNLNISDSNSSSAQLSDEQLLVFFTIFLIAFFTVLIFSLAYQVFLSNVIRVGNAKFWLNVADEGDHKFVDIFSGFQNYKSVVLVGLRTTLTISLLTLLFIIPGIIASYNYAMVPYIQVEHPEYSPWECMYKSKTMMYGNRWQLFCLEMSFFGWMILTIFTCGVGGIWLNPYMETARAVFYRSISTGLRPVVPNVIDAE